jgi:hypothetical protein
LRRVVSSDEDTLGKSSSKLRPEREGGFDDDDVYYPTIFALNHPVSPMMMMMLPDLGCSFCGKIRGKGEN